MKIVINAILAQRILFYSQQFLQLTLELLLMFIHNATQKKMLHMLTLIQRFFKHINGKSQTN